MIITFIKKITKWLFTPSFLSKSLHLILNSTSLDLFLSVCWKNKIQASADELVFFFKSQVNGKLFHLILNAYYFLQVL